MYWVLQENLHQERGHDNLVTALQRAGLPHSEHKIIPFVGDLLPDISPDGDVIVIGTYSMCRLAERKGWKPGSFDVGRVPYTEQAAHWGSLLLNADATVCAFGAAAPKIDRFFIRPTADSKYFAGTVMDRDGLRDWQRRIVGLGEDDGTGLRSNTEILWAAPKEIDAEYRLWIIDGVIATSSTYPKAIGAADPAAIEFGRRAVAQWNPLPAFVLDVCHSAGAWKIIEINTLNASGFYAADLDKLVTALETLNRRA